LVYNSWILKPSVEKLFEILKSQMSPTCANAVKCDMKDEWKVYCSCGFKFCFKCSEEAFPPIVDQNEINGSRNVKMTQKQVIGFVVILKIVHIVNLQLKKMEDVIT